MEKEIDRWIPIIALLGGSIQFHVMAILWFCQATCCFTHYH